MGKTTLAILTSLVWIFLIGAALAGTGTYLLTVASTASANHTASLLQSIGLKVMDPAAVLLLFGMFFSILAARRRRVLANQVSTPSFKEQARDILTRPSEHPSSASLILSDIANPLPWLKVRFFRIVEALPVPKSLKAIPHSEHSV